MSVNSQYVTLGVADDLFAVPVERVQEILEPQPIARMPHAPADFLGVIDVRGQSVPVIDLRTKLAMPAVRDTENTRIVVLDVAMGGVTGKLGLKADRVIEVTSFDGGAIEPPPQIGARWNAECVAGVGRRNGRFVTVFDLDRLFALEELAIAGRVPLGEPVEELVA